MTDILMRNGIDVNFIKLEEKDPSEIGFRKVIDILKQSKKVSFSDLIRMKLDGKSEKHLEVW